MRSKDVPSSSSLQVIPNPNRNEGWRIPQINQAVLRVLLPEHRSDPAIYLLRTFQYSTPPSAQRPDPLNRAQEATRCAGFLTSSPFGWPAKPLYSYTLWSFGICGRFFFLFPLPRLYLTPQCYLCPSIASCFSTSQPFF